MNELQKAVLNQLGYDTLTTEAKETLTDITNHGLNGGFTGFIYYTDTTKFYTDNKKLILSMANEQAEDFGISISEMVAGFGCCNESPHEVEAWLLDLDEDYDTSLPNCLAWYAAEEVARELIED